MGAKYLPSVKDLKANLRFQQKQEQLNRLKRLAASPPAKPAKKK